MEERGNKGRAVKGEVGVHHVNNQLAAGAELQVITLLTQPVEC